MDNERKLTLEEAMKIADTIRKTPAKRLPAVFAILRQAGVNVQDIQTDMKNLEVSNTEQVVDYETGKLLKLALQESETPVRVFAEENGLFRTRLYDYISGLRHPNKESADKIRRGIMGLVGKDRYDELIAEVRAE